MIISNKILPLFYFSLIAIMIISNASYADDKKNKTIDILPQITTQQADTTINTTTHPDLRMTPDKSELIKLDKDIGSIVIGNPAHINVIADSSKTIVIIPREIGATHFSILDKNGQIIMQRHVIVASPKEKYIRIKRSCTSDSENCKDTSIMYCPNMCHEINISNEKEKSTNKSTQKNISNNNNNENLDSSLQETE